ncbi:uncharacterized protein LOC142769238 [Rhipicephalus microplus]|uniref:uncharacterized protein LOC142769238 n=1 Tax=Rhipicephalus microplus TaxID=6941 RepID=UPI003F6D01CD
MSSKPVIKKLMKEMHGVDRNAKTVLAIGSYDYCHNFVKSQKILHRRGQHILSRYICLHNFDGMECFQGTLCCRPPSVITTFNTQLIGLLCEQTNFTGGPENNLGYPILTYGVTSNDSKVLALSEFNNSLAVKFTTAVKNFVGYRERTTWLLYNVHSLGSGNQCGDRPFNVVRLFCMA